MAGYAEGARQAQAERAADLASQKATWAAAQARAGAMVSQLASATEEYLAHFGPRDGVLTEQLIRAAFELAEAVVTCELRTSPDLAIEVAKRVLATLPTGPAVVRVNPGDEELLREAAGMLGTSRDAVTVMADPVVGPGGCIVTSGAKTVDARIEEALARARAALCSPADPLTSSYDGAAGYGAAGRDTGRGGTVSPAISLRERLDAAKAAARPRVTGRIRSVVGMSVTVEGVQAAIGEAVALYRPGGDLIAEVVAIDDDGLVCMPLGELSGIRSGATAEVAPGRLSVPVGEALRGRVVDALGRPIDGGPSLRGLPRVTTPGARRPTRCAGPWWTARCRSAYGPSTRWCPAAGASGWAYSRGQAWASRACLSMVARGTEADISVLALVGERGREVREMIEHDLGPTGLARRCRGRRHVRRARPDAPAGGPYRDADRRVVQGQRAPRRADDGQPHPLLHGPARGRAGRGRAAGNEGLPALGVRPAAPPPRARRCRRTGQHYRAVYRPRRRRRHERPHRRRLSFDPGRPHSAFPPVGYVRAFPQHRHPRVGFPCGAAGNDGRADRRRPPNSAG